MFVRTKKLQKEAYLKEAIFATWNTITFEKILYFIDSMPELVK
ncbi:6222_t:CDS:1, partial [Ambispora leptoticha]